jgi:glycosyltransferase involved in cell wall biosynthesis
MYLVPIHVPIYIQGGERLLATDWKRSLLLLRDSFDGRFGRIQVLAPSLDARVVKADQALELVRPSDEIDLFPSFDLRTSNREFWSKHVHTWRRDIEALMPNADVVHSGFCDVYRPLTFLGFVAAQAADKPTVFVQDTDQVLQALQLANGADLRRRVEARVYSEVFERSVRYGVKRAALTLLKGRALQTRYARYAKNPKAFHDTSYLTSEVVPAEQLERRIDELLQGKRPMRLVYCGRLEARKGLDEAIDALMRARAQGANVTFDIIGDGEQRAALERQAVHLRAGDAVKFQGTRNYGPELLRELSTYDAILFTPIAEDTPRMIFDGYAAGLPLLGYAIEYVREREAEDGAARSVPMRDPSALAALLCRLDRDRSQLAKLARRAHDAAYYHAADAWYKRRAEWTYEAAAAYRPARS